MGDIGQMTIPNPFISARDKPQFVSWKFFIDKEIYHLEFILPFKAIIEEFREGGYMNIAAEVKEDHNLNVSMIQKDNLIVMNIPVKTFERAWMCVNRSFREQFTADDNLRIKFFKSSKQDIRIKEIERLKPCNGQKEFAEDFYNQPDLYDKHPERPVKVRRTEEL